MWTQRGDHAEILDAIQQPIWTIRPDGAVAYLNAAWRAFTPTEGAVSPGAGCPAHVHADDVTTVQDGWRDARDAVEMTEVAFRLRRADGAWRWQRARIAPVAGSIDGANGLSDGADGNDAARGWFIGSAVDIHDQQVAVEALHSSRVRFQDVVEQADDIVWSATPDGTMLTANPAVGRVLGHDPDAVIGHAFIDFVVPEDRARADRMWERTLRGEERASCEVDAVAADGRRVTLQVSSRRCIADDGAPIMHGVARDITIRRERIREVELTAAIGAALTARAPLDEQLQGCVQAMVDHLGAAFARVWLVDDADPDRLVLRASAGMYAHLDGPHSSIRVGEFKIGRIAADRAPHLSNDMQHDPETNDRAWATREGLNAFAGYPLEIGHQLLGVVAVFARQPLSLGTLWTLRSIVDAIAIGIDRDRAERAQDAWLQRERSARDRAESVERRYREVFEGVADAIIITDVDRQVQDVNAAASRLLGFSSQAFMEHRLDDMMDESPSWMEAMVTELTTGGVWSGEAHLRRADGTTLPGEVRATLVNLPDGAVILSTIRDVTERHHLARLQRDFLAMVTHDLRTPLTSIKGWAQLLRRRQRDDERTVRTIDNLLGQVDQMEGLTNNLAELVRDEAGRLTLTRSTVDLVDLVQRQIVAVRERFPHHAIRLEPPVSPVIGSWDRQRVAQVCQNLLTNAVKYSPDGGDITVRVLRSGTDACLEVHDSGVGIPASRLPTLFDRIYRRDMTGAGGLGLGLHISAMMVRAHGGDIRASSRPGEGSVFTVTLPLGDEHARVA